MLDRIDALRAEAEAQIASANTAAELEDARVRHLGRKAELPNLLRGVAELAPEERGKVGKAANQARQMLEALVEARQAELDVVELDARLITDRVDVTLPGDPPQPVGRLHLLTQTRREIEDVFVGLGFTVAEGPEIESTYYNFDALNHDAAHPARARTDTFYVAQSGPEVQQPSQDAGPDDLRSNQLVLRTHTSPMQIRYMEAHPPPIAVIIPGRVYRRDSDATHTPQFHQVEGMWVDEDVSLTDLKGTLLAFARAIFGPDREVRVRPHFFPFTEPSVEVDVSCFNCARDGSPCTVCRAEGWLEILDAGMVDPNVFGHVREHGYDPDRIQGWAFGMGVERVAMLKHAVPDLRLLYDNDLRFLEQFG
ncbi:MAG: phenylalanine--tRNA ligase subunit alpha [Solirubrobacteraceae bacterium]